MLKKIKTILMIALLSTSSLMTACDDTKAVNDFTANTERTARYTEDLLKIVDELHNQQFLNAGQSLATVTAIRKANKFNQELVTEASKYVTTTADGKKELHFTEDGKANVVRLATSLKDVGSSLVNDPVLNSLSPETRSRINLITTGLNAAVLATYTFATKIKPEKPKPTPTPVLTFRPA